MYVALNELAASLDAAVCVTPEGLYFGIHPSIGRRDDSIFFVNF